jgi:hypothetical protein
MNWPRQIVRENLFGKYSTQKGLAKWYPSAIKKKKKKKKIVNKFEFCHTFMYWDDLLFIL